MPTRPTSSWQVPHQGAPPSAPPQGGGVAPPSHSPADMPNAWAITDSEAESDGGRQAPRLRGRPPVSLGGVPLTALRLARSNRPHDRVPSFYIMKIPILHNDTVM